MSQNKTKSPTHTIVVETGGKDDKGYPYTRKVGVAWETEGGAIYLKPDFPLLLTDAIRVLPVKDDETQS